MVLKNVIDTLLFFPDDDLTSQIVNIEEEKMKIKREELVLKKQKNMYLQQQVAEQRQTNMYLSAIVEALEKPTMQHNFSPVFAAYKS